MEWEVGMAVTRLRETKDGKIVEDEGTIIKISTVCDDIMVEGLDGRFLGLFDLDGISVQKKRIDGTRVEGPKPRIVPSSRRDDLPEGRTVLSERVPHRHVDDAPEVRFGAMRAPETPNGRGVASGKIGPAFEED